MEGLSESKLKGASFDTLSTSSQQPATGEAHEGQVYCARDLTK